MISKESFMESCKDFERQLNENFGLELTVMPTFTTEMEFGFTLIKYPDLRDPNERLATFKIKVEKDEVSYR